MQTLENNSEKVKGFIRAIQVLFIIVFMLGAVWQSTIVFELTIQQFMMLYGALGAIVCEVIIRLLEWKFPEEETEEVVDESEPEKENSSG